jgi:hypothetical protein
MAFCCFFPLSFSICFLVLGLSNTSVGLCSFFTLPRVTTVLSLVSNGTLNLHEPKFHGASISACPKQNFSLHL